eukprot:TRINITY_DN66991_c1_g1_i1.p1 TRINITY_DN66991_c1_g1~~TRINITY_DN66991_c1_g1_i1.p1  ORF type:complete len:266 (+),score=35.29 TRINITY_DN66991_c1_g1_i1:127-924(+)
MTSACCSSSVATQTPSSSSITGTNHNNHNHQEMNIAESSSCCSLDSHSSSSSSNVTVHSPYGYTPAEVSTTTCGTANPKYPGIWIKRKKSSNKNATSPKRPPSPVPSSPDSVESHEGSEINSDTTSVIRDDCVSCISSQESVAPAHVPLPRDEITEQQLSSIDPMRYKTQLCRHWRRTNQCPLGKQCLFAHGWEERRTIPSNQKLLTTSGHVPKYYADGAPSACPVPVQPWVTLNNYMSQLEEMRDIYGTQQGTQKMWRMMGWVL